MSNQYLNSPAQKTSTDGVSERDNYGEVNKSSDRDTRLESGKFADLVNCNCFNVSVLQFNSTPNQPKEDPSRAPTSTLRSTENVVYANATLRMQKLVDKTPSADSKHLELSTIRHLQNPPPGADIRFSVIMPNNAEVNVRAFENPDHWRVSMEARDADLKKLIEKSRSRMAESMRKELGKKVLIDVE